MSRAPQRQGAGSSLPRRAPTPADLLLLAGLLGIILLTSVRSPASQSGSVLQVYGAGGTLQRDIHVDGDVPIPGPLGETLLRVRAGRAWIAAAPCRSHVCQRMGAIRGGTGSLVCVPNRVVVRFDTAPESLDGVTR